MRRIRFLMAVLAFGLIVAVVAGEPAHTQGPEGSDPLSLTPGTAPPGQEDSWILPDGPARQEEAAPDPAQTYNATLRIPVAALKPRTSDVEWQAGGEGGCVYAGSGAQNTWWSAPLYLPDGSTLRYFRMYYNDQNATANCDAYLTVYDLYGRIVTEWGISSSGTGMTYVTTAQLDHVIEYSQYSYVINWRPNDLGTDMQVCGFRVYYETHFGLSYLPYVSKED
jgi:hypothetical protein